MYDESKINARQIGGLWIGFYGEFRITNPYLNKGMAVRQTKNYLDKHGAPGSKS